MYKILVMHSKGGTGKTLMCAALSDILPNSQLVDLDPQMSLTLGMHHAKRRTVTKSIQHVPKDTKYVIIDTPPYRLEGVEDLMQSVNKIIVPCSEGFTDLFAAAKTVEALNTKSLLDKAVIVFGRARLPINSVTKEVRQAFKSNFTGIKIAATGVSQRIAYQKIFTHELKGIARKEIETLCIELGILNNTS